VVQWNMAEEDGRDEMIRTSDPLLSKQRAKRGFMRVVARFF